MDIISLIETGKTNPALLFLLALILGGLHALEPGHSKTMIASYIIAIHGKITDAVLLGLSSAISHSLLIWVLALFALQYGDRFLGEKTEPYFLILSGFLVVCMGLWMLWRRRKSQHYTQAGHEDAHAAHHAKEIRAQFQNGKVSKWQTILFGLSGGLVPCPAALTVLVICYQIKKITLGLVLLSAFSIGLGAVMVLVGIVVALGLKFISKRKTPTSQFIKLAPIFSAGLIFIIGLLIIWSGFYHLP